MKEKAVSQAEYHWINKAIDSLDPYSDYEQIWRLSSSYRLSDFMNNMIYALTFPNFIVTLHGAEVVWRDNGGKVVHKATNRVEETENYNALWWWYGPSDLRCQEAIQRINKLHERLATRYPGNFAHNDDYIYTLAFSAILMHRLMQRLGLGGFSEKEKIAAHLFWRDMSRYFVVEGGAPVNSYPEDWDGLIEFCEAFENMSKPANERGYLIAEAIYNQFAFRYFPPGLRWLGRAIPVSLSLPTTLETLKIQPVNPILKAIICFATAMLFRFLSILPDPKVAFWPNMENMTHDDKRKRRHRIGAMDKAYVPWVNHQPAADFAGCPFAPKVKDL